MISAPPCLCGCKIAVNQPGQISTAAPLDFASYKDYHHYYNRH
jgi:hypothetical protein